MYIFKEVDTSFQAGWVQDYSLAWQKWYFLIDILEIKLE